MCYNHNNQGANFNLKRGENYMKKNNHNIARILALLILFAITITGMVIVNKILITAINMAVIRENILFYNEQEIKTSQMTREVEFFFREREEKYYKSADPLVRGFTKLPGLIKALVVLLMIALVAIIAYIWIYIFRWWWKRRQWKRRHRRRRRRN